MGLTSALYSTLTGLNANQARLDVIGNNIANVNTVGYKSSRLDFQTLFSQTMSNGAPPSSDNGGTNPFQIGMGTQEGAVTRNFTDGSRQVTGVNTDLAIEGDGFFVLQGSEQLFSRDGTFKLNSDDQLVNASGYRVQGYGVDSDFNITQGTLSDISIPIGSLTIAQATSNVTFSGDLNATGIAATKPSVLDMTQQFTLSPAAAPAATSLLTDLHDSTSGTQVFQVGDVISARGTKGSRTLATKTLTVGAGTTLQDYMSFLAGTLGINTTAGSNGTSTTPPPADPGVALVAGTTANDVSLEIVGNRGTANDLALQPTDISINRGGAISRPFSFTKTQAADGESVTTPVTVYDSLGAPVTVNLTTVLVQRDDNGSQWQYFVESPDNTNGDPTGLGTNTAVAMGTLQFDNLGRLTTATPPTIAIDRTNTGATPLLQFTLSFDSFNALSGVSSSLAATGQDGSASGRLQSFAIGNDGTIVGSFTNGIRKNLGQIALATFTNNQGLVDKGSNTFVTGPNSGLPVIAAPGQFATGNIVAGALELSNFDLSQEFVNLISASTGFSASSRVITTSNQLLQELLASAR